LLLDPAACQIQCDRTRNLEAALLLDRHESGLGGYDTLHIPARAPSLPSSQGRLQPFAPAPPDGTKKQKSLAAQFKRAQPP
jgi:hypothetical protein